MVKKVVLLALMVFPFIAFAQETHKIAYINYQEIAFAMPEYTQMQDSLKKSAEVFQAELQIMTDEYTKKYTDFLTKQDSLIESIKVRRQQELDEIRQRAANFEQYAGQKQEELQQALSTPILEKLQKAINDVGKENNYLYIANSQVFLYVSPDAVEATQLVKKKLGIK